MRKTPSPLLVGAATLSLFVLVPGAAQPQRSETSVLPRAALAARHFGNDRHFSLGEFFDVTYLIPEAITQGNSKVTVRSQAKPGTIADGVFGARIVWR